jgi:multidrug efflux pump subunit AcrA (membrane-fusion protein)
MSLIMGNNKLETSALILGIVCLVASCSKAPDAKIADLTDNPVSVPAVFADMPEYIPAYGIAVLASGREREIVVNIEQADTRRLQIGQTAEAFRLPRGESIPCRVKKALRSVSAETGQSVAWLKPTSLRSKILAGSFFYARILVGVRRHVLVVPPQAIFSRDGKTWVVIQKPGTNGRPDFSAREIQIGLVNRREVEALKGLNPKDLVVVQGGLGYVFPGFMADAD